MLLLAGSVFGCQPSICCRTEYRSFYVRTLVEHRTVFFNLGFANTSYINQIETQEPLEP
jgi:hypothetical protein